MGTSCDIFLSHVEEDFAVIEEVAHALDAEGYATWYYERDSVPGEPYLVTIGRVIRECRAIVVVISQESLEHGHQIDTEVFQAYEGQKRFFPLLRGVEFDEFRRRQPTWHVATAGAVAITIPSEGVAAVLPTLLKGLTAAGIEPAKAAGPPADELEQGITEVRTLLNDPERRAEAEQAIRGLIAAHPASSQVYRLLGEFCNRSFRHADAVAALERATQLDPASALARWELALAYRQVGRDAEAVASLKRALELGLDQSRQRHAMTLLSQLEPGGR